MKSIKRMFGIFLLLFLLIGILCVGVNAAPIDTKVEGLVLDDPSQYSTLTEYTDASIEKILAYLDLEDLPDWMKVLRIHDFVCMFVEYDWDNYLAGNTFNQNLYNTLTTGKTMCDGYARLTQRLLLKEGIECEYISCPMLDHAWNVVKLDGKWYNLDVTWDDPDRYDEIRYDYFLRCDESFGHLRGQVDESEFFGYNGITISQEDFYCGNFGEDLYWVISDDKTLTFYGDGDTITNSCTANEKVRHAVISEGITTIENESGQNWVGFTNCDGMTDVTIPTSLTYIGVNSFSGCYWLTDVYYAGSEEQWNEIQILAGNDDLLNARIHFATSTETWDAISGTCGDNLTWTLTEDRVLQISGTGDMYDYTAGEAPWHAYMSYIYDVVIGNGVTGIGDHAFDDCYRLVGCTISDSVVSIGNYAFSDCLALRTFTIPDNVSFVGEGTFYGCNKLRNVVLTGNITKLSDRMFYGCHRLFKVAIPEGIVSIGDYCFYDCSSFSMDSVPESLTSIGQYAFAYCTVMDEIVTSPNITKIATGTFYGCKNISRLEIPDYITDIGAYAFGQCDWLETLTFPGTPISVGAYAFCDCNYLLNVTLTGVTAIEEGAFSGCYRLKEIAIPDSVTSIGAQAFAKCSALKSVVIPGSVKTVGDCAFQECRVLTSVTLKSGITAFGDRVFSYCLGLSEVILPDSVTSLGAYTFEECRSLKSINLPKNLYELGDGVFYGCALKSITVPGSVKRMGTGVFVSCSSLETAIFENGVGSIGENTFGQCYSLTSVTLPSSITQIGEGVFSYCSKLKSISIPCGVTSVGYRAFQGCSLTDVYYGGTQNMWRQVEIGERNTTLTDATIHFAEVLAGREGVCNNTLSVWWLLTTAGDLTIYGNGAIESCGWNSYSDEITSITILPGVTAIGGQVFRGLKNLVAVQIPDTVTSIDSFGSCTSLKSIVIPDSVTELGTYTFLNCTNLTDVTLPSGLTALPDGIFAYCTALKSITLPAGITSIGSNAFDGCASLTNIQLPAGLTGIGEYAFYNCSSLSDIVIPSGVTAIQDATFYGCSALTSIDLPEGVTTIGEWVFYDCNNLTSAVLPATLTSVGENSFSLWLLADVYFTGSQEAWEQISLASGNYGLVYANMHYNWVQHTDHTYGDWTQTQTPTCTEAGEARRSCAYCDHFETRAVEATGHTEGNVAVENETASSCTLSGSYDEVVYCTICTEELRRTTVTVPATGHSYSNACDADCNTCGKTRTVTHDYAAATCTEPQTCKACGATSGEPLAHTYNILRYNDTEHWHECVCGAEEFAYRFGHGYSRVYDGDNHWLECYCGATADIEEHNFSTQGSDGTYHWKACFCGKTTTKETHSYAAATCTVPKTCKVCGVTSGSALGHSYSAATCTKAKTCTVCKKTSGNALGHKYSNACDTTCNTCGAKRTITHSYKTTTTKATLSKSGKTVKTCTVCGSTTTTTIKYAKTFKLSTTSYTYNGKERKPSVTIKDSDGKTISSSNYTVTYASGRKNVGTYKVTVSMKGNYSGTKTLEFKINPLSISKCTAKLSTTSYTYNGKVRKPSVTIKDSAGNTISSSHYTVSYASGRKYVGTYKVTIKMKGSNYSGTKTLTFKINPKAASINKLTAKSKALSVKLNTRTSQATGYQIQYSTSKSFKSYKTATITSYKTSTKTISGLKAKTTYYVRVRTYKTVNGVKYYSGWSSYKYMKTK